MPYSILEGQSNVSIFNTTIDLSIILTEYGKTLECLNTSFATITADAYPTTSYKGKIKRFGIMCSKLSDSALTWMVESGFLSSPTIVEMHVHFLPDDRAIGMFPHIKLPNLTILHIWGLSSETEEEALGRHIFQLLDHSPSITTLNICCNFTCDVSVFTDHLGSMPALRKLSVGSICAYSESFFKWALSDRNTSVELLAMCECPSMISLSPNEFFLHPCVAYVRCVTEPMGRYEAMHAAKRYTVHFAYMVRNNEALARLPTELVRMIFTFCDWLSEIYT